MIYFRENSSVYGAFAPKNSPSLTRECEIICGASSKPKDADISVQIIETLRWIHLALFYFLAFCHQYFLILISATRCTPVSSWSNRPLLSGGDSSCSWVFCSCTGPQGETYTQLEGWKSMSPVAIALIWNWVHSGGYSHEKTQTSSFSCKVYWDTSSGMWSGVTARQWNAIHKSKHWKADIQAIVMVSQSA